MLSVKKKGTTVIAIVGSIVPASIMIFGTIWMGRTAGRDAETAARSTRTCSVRCRRG